MVVKDRSCAGCGYNSWIPKDMLYPVQTFELDDWTDQTTKVPKVVPPSTRPRRRARETSLGRELRP